ncbi:GntR family transcriptional regulator [Ectothiorhodospiraceae bacterium WFHF3C12]|nr:GntR family transcriptional regulator [Ectothiorhodospiraceae bacterium WFHF3C12]
MIQAIRDGISTGRYVPGQRLIEADLTRELGVSRGPVREALKRLAAEHIITLNRNKGAYVRLLTRREARDLLQVVEELLGFAARLAARHIDDEAHREHRARFQRSLERLLEHQNQGFSYAYIEDRDRFYGAMMAIGGNRELPRLLPVTLVQLQRRQFQRYEAVRDPNLRFMEYRSIGEAVLAGNARLAERYTRLHVRRIRLAIRRLPDEAFAKPIS